MEIIIRKAVSGEEAAIADVNVRTWQTTYRGSIDGAVLEALPQRQGERSERMRREVAEGRVMAAFCDGRLIGFALFGPARDEEFSGLGEVYALYVLDTYQKMGVGRRLVGAVEDEFRQSGYGGYYIACLTENGSCAFYEKLGGRRAEEGSCTLDGHGYALTTFVYELS